MAEIQLLGITHYPPFGWADEHMAALEAEWGGEPLRELMCWHWDSKPQRLLDRLTEETELDVHGYHFEELISVLKLLRKKAPKIAIRTSVLVGFPGESEEDFGATTRVIQEIDFDEVTINRYEDRPLTASSKMDDKVPQEIIESRAQFLVKNMGCNLLS